MHRFSLLPLCTSLINILRSVILCASLLLLLNACGGDDERVEPDKVTPVVKDSSHITNVSRIATLYNNGVGGPVVMPTVGTPNIGAVGEEVATGKIDARVITWSATQCFNLVENSYTGCALFEEFDDHLLIMSGGNYGITTSVDIIGGRTFTEEQLADISVAINNGNFMFAVGLDSLRTSLHPASTSCGAMMMTICVAAPFNVVSGHPDANGVFPGYISGTSYSAPILGVTAKLLMEAEPWLTNVEVVRLICKTARDLGDRGPDPVYGCGALDLTALFNEFGEWVGSAAIPGFSQAPKSALEKNNKFES